MQGQELIWSIIGSVAALALGLGGVIRGWQMGYKDRFDLISDWDNRPLLNPARAAKAYSRAYIGIGSILIVMPTLLLLGLNILIWAGIVGIIVGFWFYAIDTIVIQARAT